MTPEEVAKARKTLGFKTAADMGRALELEGRDPGRTVRRWEAGETIPGLARVAIRALLRIHALETGAEAPLALAAPYLAPTPPESPHAPPQAARMDLKHRRRG